MKQYKLIAFDADGTLVGTKSGATFRKDAADWQWLPGRLDKLSQLKRDGVRMAVATNQGGVAFGFLKVEDIRGELQKMCRLVGIPMGGLYVCYTHPKGKIEQYRLEDYRRKPGPGMLIDAMKDFGAEPEETLFVGDMDDDRRAAASAGCSFVWSTEFFK